MKINTKSIFSKWLFAVLIVAAVFAIGTVDVFAGSASNGNDFNPSSYDITDYKLKKFTGYDYKDYYGKDILCTAGTSSQHISSSGNGGKNICDSDDPTVHQYPAWMVLVDPQFSSVAGSASSSFTPGAYLFTSDGHESEVANARWRALDSTNISEAMNNTSGYNKATANTSIRYQMVYLHRISNGLDLYRNYRTEIMYENSGDFVSESSIGHYLSKYNGAFVASNTVLYYTPVPHVLGSEGTYYYSEYEGNNSQPHSIIAVMEEKSGAPVPLVMYKDKAELTGFANIYYDGDGSLESEFPYGRDVAQNYTSLNSIRERYNLDFENKLSSLITYNAYSVHYPKNGTIIEQSIDTKSGLHTAIIDFGGPQYVGSVEIALDEAITQRYSTYAFMMATGETGGSLQVANGWIYYPTNIWPELEVSRGAYALTPRPSYYFFNGSQNDANNFGVIQIDMIGKDGGAGSWESRDAEFLSDREPYPLNVNFKHSFTTYARGRCFDDYGDGRCSFRHKYNYFNDMSVKKITFSQNGNNVKTYWAYVLEPKRASYKDSNGVISSNYINGYAWGDFVSNAYTLVSNSGYTTFYYSDTNKNGTHQDDRFNKPAARQWDVSAYIKSNSDGQLYSDANNAWGVWRQSGYSSGGVAFGGQFAKDTGAYPTSPYNSDGMNLYEDMNRDGNAVCRFPISKNRSHGLFSQLNIDYMNSYINIFKKGDRSSVTVDAKFDSLTDTFYQAVRTQPEWVLGMFRLTNDMLNNNYGYGNTCRNIGTEYSKYMIGKGVAGVSQSQLSSIYNNAANAICENFGTTCSASNIHTVLSNLPANKSVPDITNGRFLNAYHAIMDALGKSDELSRGLSYGEHLAYIWYNFYTLVNMPDEYAVGQLFATRGNGGFYAYYAVLQSDKSNIVVLNDETRFGKGQTGNPLGTNLETVELSNLGNYFGPSLFLINAKGDVYNPDLETGEMTCPSGYTKEGNMCVRTYRQAYNTRCNEGYVFDYKNFECMENPIGTTYCPEGYTWLDKKCLSYTGTTPICPDGQWDNEQGACTNKIDPVCPTGYELKDVNYDNRIVVTNNYTFATGNGNLGKFTVGNATNLKQEDSASISYTISNSNAYIQISGLSLNTSNVKMIQLKVKNASSGAVGKIAYVTNASTTYTSDKQVTFPMYVNNDRGYATYTIDVSGGRWTDTVTGLRFYLGGASSGKIIIDNIAFGSVDPDYKKELACISEESPSCPSGFTMKDGRCYGSSSSLSSLPAGYELSCDHVTPGSGEKVTLVNFKVGDSVNISGDQEDRTFVAPVTGNYYIEAWGASNGTSKGGYTAGLISLNEGDTLHIRNGVQNANTITVVAKNGKQQSNIVITAMSGGKGTNNTSSMKLTKAGTEWFKKTTETTNTTWTGEKGHSGNGYVRVTFYSYKFASSTNTQKKAAASNSTTAYSKEVTYKGYEQSVTLDPGTYTFEAWGAQGGSLTNNGTNYSAGTIPSSVSSAGKLGGYAKGTITINSRTTYYVYVGGVGGSRYDDIDEFSGRNNNGGYNGGGSGSGQSGPGGGGATHVTTVANQAIPSNASSYITSSSSNLLLIAGGGGAGSGCTGTSTQSYRNGGNGGTGWYGSEDQYPADNGGGGAGYAGGYGSSSDDGKCGYSGTSYVSTSMTATSTAANSRSGNGLLKITGTVKVEAAASGTVLGYYISAPTTNATVATCYVSPSSETVTATNAFANYLNSYQIPKCSVRGTIANGAGTSWNEEIFGSSGNTGNGGTGGGGSTSTVPVGTVYNYDYNGTYREVTLEPGVYKLEAWGAQGGTGWNSKPGGKGGYSTGTITLTRNTTLYIYVGGAGSLASSSGSISSGGFNGGGGMDHSDGSQGGTGGGASDIRIGSTSLYARVIVAGGGGGAGDDNATQGGYGGGSSGQSGVTSGGSGATQTSGYSFGQGGSGTCSSDDSGGGGGGWYGGYGAPCDGDGGGGSGYVLTSSSTKPSGYLLDSQYYLTSTSMKAGNTSFTSPTGGTETGHSGNGYVRITKTGDVAGSTGGTTTTTGTPINFTYTGSRQQTTLQPGTYILEVWGAQGGANTGTAGGKGGYSVGEITLTTATNIYVYVGGQGSIASSNSSGGFNGGGAHTQGGLEANATGGGASDIRIGQDNLYARVIVAGGGGGGSYSGGNGSVGGYGGGASGGSATGGGGSGTQTAGGSSVYRSAVAGGFGYGGYVTSGGNSGGGTGGGGWYGGGAGQQGAGNANSAGGGGSGYVLTSSSTKPSGYLLGSQYYLTNASTKAGNTSFTSPTGTTETGHSGNGYVRITPVTTTNSGNNNTGNNNTGNNNEYYSTFGYTGSVVAETLDPGTYTFQVWGAQGGTSSYYAGGLGGYSTGTITLTERTTVYIYVGGTTSNYYGGFNGGGNGNTNYSASRGGGGASDIRIGTDSIYSRVIVAGGGGGAMYQVTGGYGGGTSGGSYGGATTAASNRNGGAGGQTAGGVSWSTGWTSPFGSAYNHPGSGYENGGGGGGWFGGAPGYDNDSDDDGRGGGGGSGFVYTSSTASYTSSSYTGGTWLLNSNYYLTSAATYAGNTSFPAPYGGTETGHAGNGFVVITGTLSNTFENDFTPIVKDRCSSEAQYKLLPTCDHVANSTYNVAKEVCEKQNEVQCTNGIYNNEFYKCEYKLAPTGCNNDGVLYGDLTNGYACYREATATCDTGYSLVDGICTKTNIARYKNELCPSAFTFDRPNKVCARKVQVPLEDVNVKPLEEEMNVVEVNKVYKFTNYVGYRSSAAKANKEVTDKNPFTSTTVFPAINITFTLMQSGDTEIKSSEYCREHKNASGCAAIGESVKRYEINLKDIVNTYGAQTSINKYKEIFIGDKKNSQFHSANPETGSSSVNNKNTSEYLWSVWQGGNIASKTDSQFSYLWSAIDVYFLFKENEFCYMNKAAGETLVDREDFLCMPYVAKDGFTVMRDTDGDGVEEVVLDMEKDDNGKTKTNTIHIRTQVTNPNDYVDGDFATLYGGGYDPNNPDSVAKLLMDNNYFTDDVSDFVTEFKLAPDGDVYIDRFEVVRADTDEVVFAADAMTEDRCANGYKPASGQSLFTQTYSQEAYDGGSRTDPSDCAPFNPQDATTTLETTVNYYVRIYTKYIAFDEIAIEEETPAAMDYIAVDIMHLANEDTDNAFGLYIGSLLDAALDEDYTIRDGLVDSTGNNVTVNDIIHNDIINVCPVEGVFAAAPANKKANVVTTSTGSMNDFYRKDNNFATNGVKEPVSALIIPAEGLFAKGKTDGYYQVSVSGEIGSINAYPTWDIFDFRYFLGEGPDIQTTLVLKCNGGEYKEKTNSCVLVPQGESGCKLYVVLENIGNIEHRITTNVKVDTASKASLVNWENGTVYSNEEDINFIDEGNLIREIFIMDVTESIYASANHTSSDNEDYADNDWANNVDENCFLFNYLNYSIRDLDLEINNENTVINVKTDCDGELKESSINVTVSGSYIVSRDMDNGDTKNVPIEYKLLDRMGNNLNASCTFTPISTTVTNGGEKQINFNSSCVLNITKTDVDNYIGLRVLINGGENGSHTFEESDYTDNEVIKTIKINGIKEGEDGEACEYKCDDTCVETNKWSINFDFLYTFDRNVKNYETGYQAHMSWTDYDVGTVSGSTTDKTYDTTAPSGNTKRAPDDYLAFKSSSKSYADLCTDYRNGSTECWRYEQNTIHKVTYYLWSKATTNVYATHAVLSSGNGYCTAQNAAFAGGTYGNQDNGNSGKNHTYANVTGSSGSKASCHGWTTAPQKNTCAQTTDWFGNAICTEYRSVYTEAANGGSKPGDYIPYAYFQDYTISDGFPTSPTTKTNSIILASQVAHTNGNQGSAHSGWTVTRTMNVCNLRAYQDISYSCPTYYTFGTADGAYSYSAKTYCESAGYGTTSRDCEWTDANNAPSTSTWWDQGGATCYRKHKDFTCGSYYSFTVSQSTINNSANGESATCYWYETVSPVVKNTTGTDYAAFSKTCSSSKCLSYKTTTDPDTGAVITTNECASWQSGTCILNQSSGCATCYKTCQYGGTKQSCTASCTAAETATTHYYATATWTASDKQTTSSSKDSCSNNITFGTHTFSKSRTYSGSSNNGYASGRGRITYSCSSGDINTGGYCYEKASDTLHQSNQRCIQWTTREYKEIKYYSTSTPDSSSIGWVSRTHDNLKNIWQYTCDTKTPTVPYPTDTTVKMDYQENITSVTQIKTVRSNGSWITLNGATIDQNVAPRRGEWFEIRFVLTYTTNRGTKPSTMPTLQAFYNNYHNIASGNNNNTTYPDGGYNHYGVLNSNHTAFGDGNTIKPKNFSDIVNNEDYGYCDARPAEPYGCSYKGNQGGTQFELSVNAAGTKSKNNVVITQGHAGATWISNQDNNGVCYYGPDNKTVWKISEFGNDYDNTAMICTDGNGGKCNPATAMGNYALVETESRCAKWSDTKKNLCVQWVRTFEIPTKYVDGEAKKGMFLPGDFDASKAITIDMRTSHFNAVGQYEKELLGLTTLSSGGSEQFFIEQVGNPIKQLCRCQSTSFTIKPENYGWGSSEWEVE